MTLPPEEGEADDASANASADGSGEDDWGDDEPLADLGGDILQFISAFLIILSLVSFVFMGLCVTPKAGLVENIGRGLWLFGTMSVGLALSWVGKKHTDKQDPLALYFIPAILIVAVYIMWVFSVGRK